MLTRLLKKLPVLVSLCVLGLAVALKANDVGFMESLKLRVFDLYQHYLPRTYQPMGVRIVDIDDASLAKLGQWPWPRPLIGKIISRLNELGAGVVAFDIVFAEPDRTSPSQLAPLWADKPELVEALKNAPDHDAVFSQYVGGANVVTGYVLTNESAGRVPKRPYGVSFAGGQGSDPKESLTRFSSATSTLKVIEDASAGNGFFNNTPDADGIVRRVPLALLMGGEINFSLAMEALRVAQGASTYLIKMAGASGEASFSADSDIVSVKNGQFEIPTDRKGNMLLYYTQDEPDRYIPAWKILEPDFDKSLVEGQLLFFGTSAPGLKDLRATPLNPALAGVEVHVQALEQVLSGQFLKRPDWLDGAEMVMMVTVGLVLILMMAKLTAIWGAIFMLMVQGAALGFSIHAFRTQGLLIDPISPGLVILMVYISESLRRYIHSEHERKQVRSAFSHYMSPALVAELARNPDKLKLGGETKELTVMFSDIRGFTTFSEKFNAEQLTGFINKFLTPMTDVILSHKGTIDKYMGDAIMAFWNAPLDVEDHASHACRAALHMFKAAGDLNAQRRIQADAAGEEFIPINIGVGLNTGDICVGNMGSDQRFDYSVLGDDVNLASRLEGQSKNYGVGIVIGENTQKMVQHFATLELDLIKVKGKTEAVRIFTLLGEESLQQNAAFAALHAVWDAALKSYRSQQWDAAERSISEARKISAQLEGVTLEGLFELYEERIATYRASPPPANWDGVYEAKDK